MTGTCLLVLLYYKLVAFSGLPVPENQWVDLEER